MFESKKELKKMPRYKVKSGFAGVKASCYRLLNRPYLDIRIYRGYRQLTRIVAADTGMDTFTVEGVGTFAMPAGNDLLMQYHDKNALYLTYNITTSRAGIPVEFEKPTKFEFPPLSPEEFQRYLESQTVADLLSETTKDLSWIWYLLVAGIAIFALLLVFGGI